MVCKATVVVTRQAAWSGTAGPTPAPQTGDREADLEELSCSQRKNLNDTRSLPSALYSVGLITNPGVTRILKDLLRILKLQDPLTLRDPC